MEIKTINKSFSNVEMRIMLSKLQPALSERNVLGYAAARNARVLSDAISEYIDFERAAIIKYGTPDMDKDGNPTGTSSISPESDNFNKFIAEVTPIQEAKQEISIMAVHFNDVIGVLSGEEILGIDWMLYE